MLRDGFPGIGKALPHGDTTCLMSDSQTLALDELVVRLSPALERRAEVLEAYLFGSHARGNAHTASDVDVAVYVDEQLADPGVWGYRAELTTDLMDAIGTNDVDVVVLNKAPPLLYHRVLRDGVRLLSRDLRATTTRAGQALSRYFDYLLHMAKMDGARPRRDDPAARLAR